MKSRLNFAELFEGQEVESFLKLFVRPEHQGMPQNIDTVLDDVKAIWEKSGFITPAELKIELIEKYLGDDADPELKKVIRNIELASNSGEKVTGYLGKEHAYLSTGLAHLYSKTMPDPIAMTEIDFSNMGGTNEYFRKLIARETELDVQSIPAHAGEHLTDRAASVVASGIISRLSSELPEGAAIVPVRSGGDELRIFFTGVDDPVALRNITDNLHTRIEYLTAKMGLHDHQHAKAPENHERNGFGAALTIKNMREIDDPSTVIFELDAEVKSWKYVLGKLRHGGIDEEFAKAEISIRRKNGLIAPKAGQSDEEFERQEMTAMMEQVKVVAEKLQSIKPDNDRRRVIERFREFADKSEKMFRDSPLKMERLNPEYDITKISREVLAEIAPMTSLEDRRTYMLNRYLEGKGVVTDARQQCLLELAARDLKSTDPSSGVLLPGEIIEAIEVYKNDLPDFRQMVDCPDFASTVAARDAGLSQAQEVKPYIMGVSFHGLAALNELFGHHTADTVLKCLASEVIEKSLREEGIERKRDNPCYVAHHGGGNFTILFKPQSDGSANLERAFSKENMEDLSIRIEQNLEKFSRRNVEEFLIDHDHDNCIDIVRKEGIKTFADIKDSKARSYDFEGVTVEKRISGLHMATSYEAIEYDPYIKGFEVVRSIREKTDAEMEKLRRSFVAAVRRDIRLQGSKPEGGR